MSKQIRDSKTLVRRLEGQHAGIINEAALRIKELELENDILAHMANHEISKPIYRHIFRGTVYEAEATATWIPSNKNETASDNEKILCDEKEYLLLCASPIKYGARVVLYHLEDDYSSQWYARPIAEFLDGRFIRLAVDDE